MRGKSTLKSYSFLVFFISAERGKTSIFAYRDRSFFVKKNTVFSQKNKKRGVKNFFFVHFVRFVGEKPLIMYKFICKCLDNCGRY